MSIHRLGHIALTVTDLARAVEFAEQKIGLLQTGREGGRVYLSSSARHHQLILEEGPAYGCSAIGFDVADSDDWQVLLYAVRQKGYEIHQHEGKDLTARSFSFSVPDGPTFEICNGVQAVPLERYARHGVRPRKLGHITLAAPDPAPFEKVAQDVLGFRLSDRLPLGEFAPGDLTWYRCNPDHHCLGLTPGPPGVHHYAWELPDFSSFQRLADHLSDNGTRFIWGPGRHGPGDNIFGYYEDSEGGMVEVYTDMLQITDEQTYVMPKWSGVEEAGNLWGPMPVPEWFEYQTPFLAPSDQLAAS